MTELECNVKSCTHNSDNCCCLNSIQVDGAKACHCDDTCCASYYEEKGNTKNATESPKVNLSISCQATNCVYNNAQKCDANHVDISGICATSAGETICATFRSK